MEEKEPLVDVKAPEGTTVTVTFGDEVVKEKVVTSEEPPVKEEEKPEETVKEEPIPEEILRQAEELEKENEELERQIKELETRIEVEKARIPERLEKEFKAAVASMNDSASMIGTSEGYVVEEFSEKVKEINSVYADLDFSLICLNARKGEE